MPVRTVRTTNTPAIKKAVGANPNIEFHTYSPKVNEAFFLQGDGMRNSAALLPELLNDGVRLLVYAGDADGMCNFIVSASFRFMNIFDPQVYPKLVEG